MTRPATRRTDTSSGRRSAGPSPQSNCNHMPGSGIHGRYVRRRPARHASFASATARRVVRSSPVKPIATMAVVDHVGADLRLELRSTSSSIFSQERVDQPGPARPLERVPARRRAAPHNAPRSSGHSPPTAAAECGQRVRSNASKISMISLSDLVTVLLGGCSHWLAAASETHQEGRKWWTRTGDPLSADRDICCPSAGRFVSAYREYPLSVLIGNAGCAVNTA